MHNFNNNITQAMHSVILIQLRYYIVLIQICGLIYIYIAMQGLSILTDIDIVAPFKISIFKPSALQSDTTFIISSGTVGKLYQLCIFLVVYT